MVVTTIYSLRAQTCHSWEVNLGGEDNNHSSQPPKLNPIDNSYGYIKYYIICIINYCILTSIGAIKRHVCPTLGVVLNEKNEKDG
jgi:hypothetical protein